MKLTKGKLSKIRNKKHQTAKRFKKSIKGNKTKTFRKRKGLNLHNTSLKKYNGGKLKDDVKEEEDTKSVVSKPEESIEKLEEPLPSTSDVVEEPEQEPVAEEPASEEAIQVEEEPVPQEPLQVEEEPVSEEASQNEEEPSEVVEPASDLMEESHEVEPTPDLITEKPVENEEASEVDQEPAVDQEPEVEPVVEQVVKNDLSIVAESLDKLAEYISDKIAQKLKYSSSSELNRDSFNAVATANNAIVEA